MIPTEKSSEELTSKLGELNETLKQELEEIKKNLEEDEKEAKKIEAEVPKDILENLEHWQEELGENHPESKNRLEATVKIISLCRLLYVESKKDSLELDLSNLGLSSLPNIIGFLAPNLETINLSNNNLSPTEVIGLNVLGRRNKVTINLDNQFKKGTSLDGVEDEKTLSLYDELDKWAPKESYIEETFPDDRSEFSESSSAVSTKTDKETELSLDELKHEKSESLPPELYDSIDKPAEDNWETMSTYSEHSSSSALTDQADEEIVSDLDELTQPTPEELNELYNDLDRLAPDEVTKNLDKTSPSTDNNWETMSTSSEAIQLPSTSINPTSSTNLSQTSLTRTR